MSHEKPNTIEDHERLRVVDDTIKKAKDLIEILSELSVDDMRKIKKMDENSPYSFFDRSGLSEDEIARREQAVIESTNKNPLRRLAHAESDVTAAILQVREAINIIK
jgi:hypothetical protein